MAKITNKKYNEFWDKEEMQIKKIKLEKKETPKPRSKPLFNKTKMKNEIKNELKGDINKLNDKLDELYKMIEGTKNKKVKKDLEEIAEIVKEEIDVFKVEEVKEEPINQDLIDQMRQDIEDKEIDDYVESMMNSAKEGKIKEEPKIEKIKIEIKKKSKPKPKRKYTKRKPKEVEKIVEIEKIVEVEKIVEIEKIVEVEVEKIVEIEKIVEVEKIAKIIIKEEPKIEKIVPRGTKPYVPKDKSKDSVPVTILKSPKIKDFYEAYIVDDNPFKIFYRGVLIYDSVNHTERPIFTDDYFTIFGRKYIYKGVRFEKYYIDKNL